MQRYLTFNRAMEDILRAKTRGNEEISGYLIYMRRAHSPSGRNEGIIPIETGKGTAGHVTANPRVVGAVQMLLQAHSKLDALEFHAHTEGTRRLGSQWDSALSRGDIDYIRNAIESNRNYQHMLLTPASYFFIKADPQAQSGLSATQLKWGSAPIRTKFDDKYDRQELGQKITHYMNAILKKR
ncbi:MAG: hypothetical protein AABX75_00970 [Nanoarchaeota archaeon]